MIFSNKYAKLKIEVETRSIEDVKKVMATGKVNRIMLDNFTPELITEALKIIEGKYETEASGGINLENIESFKKLDIDFISIGSLTHSARAVDIGLAVGPAVVAAQHHPVDLLDGALAHVGGDQVAGATDRKSVV